MSTPERWRQIETLLDAALDLPPAARPDLLDRSTAHDPELRRAVERLLDHCDTADRFLDGPAAEFAAPLLARAASDARDPEAPTLSRVGPYRIVREIGRGGMGAVYLAERDDAEFRMRVALKVLSHGVGTEHAVRRFREERRILASLDHPHIARLLDGGLTPEGIPWFSMNLVDGLPIDRYCDERTLSVDERLRLFLDVCGAVQYAHRCLVVHRDLKPSNILVAADGTVKLLDFGIAKLLDTDAASGPATRTGTRAMTPEYASPEQLRGDAISTASDVYSLGVLLYLLLTGQHPQATGGGSPRELEQRILDSEPGRPSTVVMRAASAHAADHGRDSAPDTAAADRRTTPRRLRRRLQGELDTIVLEALRKEPARRYASAERFADDVQRHLAGLPIGARPDTRGYRMRKFVGRHRWGVGAAAAVALLLLGFSTVTAVQSARIAREHASAERTTAFLIELFTSADPAVARGTVVTAQELLDRGAARVDRELGDQPHIRARMLDAMGRAYFGLGSYEQARPLLAEALATRRRLHRGDHPDLAASLYQLAYVLRNQGDFDAAELLYRESLAMRRRLLPDGRLELVSSLNGLAYVLRGRGDHQAAEALYREAIATGRERLADPHPELTVSLYGLGAALHGQGEYREAERVFREVLAMYRTLHGNEHPDVNMVLYSLARTLHERGELDAAEPVYREAIDIGRKVQGSRHPLVAIDLTGFAGLLYDRGKLAEAEALYREALDIQRAGLPDGHERTASTLVGLGQLLTAAGRGEAAEPLLREALTIRRRKLIAHHWQIAEAESELGACLSVLGRHAEAEPLLVAGYTAMTERRGREHVRTRRARQSLIDHYERQGRTDRAAAYRSDPPAPTASASRR